MTGHKDGGHTDELQALKSQLLAAAADVENKDAFCSAFSRARTTLMLSDNELAKVIQISRPTVRRWASGATAPHPIGRKAVLDYLVKRVDTAARIAG